MAELVKQKKPKQRETRRHETPLIPTRPTVVNGVRLPDAPAHNLEQHQVQEINEDPQEEEREPSPEPEELALSDESENEEVRDFVPEPVAPRIPPRSMIFPRSTSMIAPQTKTEEKSPAHKTSLTTITQYPTVPELAELPSYNAALNHPKVYPSVPQVRPPLQSSQSASALPEKTRFSAPPESVRNVVCEAPPIYPSVCTYDKDEHGLMTESNLLAFYYNPMYETADAFVDQFIQAVENPINNGSLFPLLKRLKEVADQMIITEVKDKSSNEKLQKTAGACWKLETYSVNATGKCGSSHDGTGRATYTSYNLQNEVLAEMDKLLKENKDIILDHKICEEAMFRSLCLQIQWQIILINNSFMAENAISFQTPATLIASAPLTPARISLRNALSDLFNHLRFPRLLKRYSDTIIGWINEIVCVLNKRQTCDDGIFLLCHLLRLPSPIHQWAPPFVQTFIQSQSLPKLKIDYCLALLTHLLNPIRARESFLRHVAQSENEEATWEILADDDGEVDEFSFVTINEMDLTALLDQLPISEIYSMNYNAFTSYSDKGSQFTAMVAFQLLLMKVLDNGLTNYSKPGYKSFCKQIGISLKHSVREVCNNWRLVRSQLSPNEENQLQNEVDRIVLISLNYLIHRDSVGLFQFVVALPYGAVSEQCRNRCEYALRSIKKMTIHELYETPISQVMQTNQHSVIKHRIDHLGPQDSEFLVNSLASIGSNSNSDVTNLLKQLIDVCFCDESTRDNLYKCGGEAIGQILTKRPDVLHQLLSIIDRSLSHIDTYAINVLSSSRLFDCRLTEPMMSIIGKWLINNPPEHGGNRLARRVLSGLHWGPSADGQNLWIDPEVHVIAADCIVKAHSVHCSRSNSMISKSLKQIAKLASKMGDAETHFQNFCWDLLVKLKLPKSDSVTSAGQQDLTAHYVKIVQCFEEEAPLYLEKAIPLLSDLVASASSVASVVLISRFIAQHYGDVNRLGADKDFMGVFEKILHVDQLPYAVQWLSGPSSTPTPIVRLICSAISYYCNRLPNVTAYLRAWLFLLCSSRSGWNEDAVTYQIVGTIVRIYFITQNGNLDELIDVVQQAYTQQMANEKNQSRGLFSVFSSDPPPSPLIPDSMLGISPFASFLMLLVEQNSYGMFYSNFFDALAKKDKYTLDDAIKKAHSKSNINLPLERISVFRWAVMTKHAQDSFVFPLVLQQLAIEIYKLRNGNNHTLCFARRLVDDTASQLIMNACRKSIEEAKQETNGLSRAVIGWIFTKHEVTRTGFDFSVFDLDYLLQLILTGDTTMWMDYVNVAGISSEEFAEQKLYSTTCQLTTKQRSAPQPNVEIGSPRGRSAALPFPILPVHENLPIAPHVDPMMLFRREVVGSQCDEYCRELKSLTGKYIDCDDQIARFDIEYIAHIQKLYQPTQQIVPVVITCAHNCGKSGNRTMQVNPNVLNPSVDAEMSTNRSKRNEYYTNLSALIDKVAVSSANIEHLTRMIAIIAKSMDKANRDMIQLTGSDLFKSLTNVAENDLLFSVAMETYRYALKSLGKEFVECQAGEQMNVMRLALNDFVLPDVLVEIFTPEVLSPEELCIVYNRLSEAIRMPHKSQMAFQLLGRLGMQQAAAGLPPQQFAALLPIAFSNLASQLDSKSELHRLCLQHVIFFIFHQFPSNISSGLSLALEGCNTRTTPVSLLEAFCDKLDAREILKNKANLELGAAKADECARILAEKLDDARKNRPNFYGIWGKYMDEITRLAQLFLFVPIRDSYIAGSSPAIVQHELVQSFQRIVAVFSPLIAPYSPTHPPFAPANEKEANLVLDRFVELLNALHYNSSIPPGMENVQSLIWKFYFEKLSILTTGSQHYYDVIERQLVGLNWQLLWPSKHGVVAMEKCLELRSKDCSSFVSQIFVRIPWTTILAQMNEDNRPSYLAAIFGVLTRIASRPRNYDKVGASLSVLVRSLSSRHDWGNVESEEAERLSIVVGCCLPADSMPNPTEIVGTTQLIWRKLCSFVPKEAFSPEALAKQRIWLRTECQLLLKSDATLAPAAYNSLISDVNSLAINHSNLRAFCIVARELTSLWKNISDPKLGESFVSLWNDYLATNQNSPLILTSLNTLIDSLNSDQLTTALKVMEKTITSYFLRTDSSWAELMHWIQFPSHSLNSIKSYLLTVPSSENKVQAQPLTLRVLMDYGNSRDENMFFELHNFVINIKPKHILNESALLSLLARLTQWISARYVQLPNNISQSDDILTPLIRWLNKSSKDESSFLTNLISSKKTAHSQKLRTVLQIFELYLTQQTLGDGKKPRCDANSPVLNSRIGTLKDLAQQKSNQHMSNAFNKATAYFTQVETHNIQSANKFLLDISKATFGDRFFNDT